MWSNRTATEAAHDHCSTHTHPVNLSPDLLSCAYPALVSWQGGSRPLVAAHRSIRSPSVTSSKWRRSPLRVHHTGDFFLVLCRLPFLLQSKVRCVVAAAATTTPRATRWSWQLGPPPPHRLLFLLLFLSMGCNEMNKRWQRGSSISCRILFD